MDADKDFKDFGLTNIINDTLSALFDVGDGPCGS